jgi:hypothetical protein
MDGRKLWVVFVLILALVTLSVSLAGCGSSNSNSFSATDESISEDTNLDIVTEDSGPDDVVTEDISSDDIVSDDSNTDTFSALAATTVTTSSALLSAVSKAKAGDVITISGTIKITSTVKCTASGTSSSRITIQGGTLDFTGQSYSSSSRGIQISGSYWKISGVTVKNAGDNGICITGTYNQIVNCNVSGCKDSGIQIYNSTAKNNSVSGGYSNNNYDTSTNGENADGYSCKLSAGSGNTFTNTTANSNSDDGYDLYNAAAIVKFSGCSASSNGKGSAGDGNGFKLGPGNYKHTLTSCKAYNNLAHGFTPNGNTAKPVLTSCTATGNNGNYDGSLTLVNCN